MYKPSLQSGAAFGPSFFLITHVSRGSINPGTNPNVHLQGACVLPMLVLVILRFLFFFSRTILLCFILFIKENFICVSKLDKFRVCFPCVSKKVAYYRFLWTLLAQANTQQLGKMPRRIGNPTMASISFRSGYHTMHNT